MESEEKMKQGKDQTEVQSAIEKAAAQVDGTGQTGELKKGGAKEFFKKHKALVIIGIIVLVALVVLGIAAAVISHNNSDDKNETETEQDCQDSDCNDSADAENSETGSEEDNENEENNEESSTEENSGENSGNNSGSVNTNEPVALQMDEIVSAAVTKMTSGDVDGAANDLVATYNSADEGSKVTLATVMAEMFTEMNYSSEAIDNVLEDARNYTHDDQESYNFYVTTRDYYTSLENTEKANEFGELAGSLQAEFGE